MYIKVHFLKYLSLGPTKILPIAPFYVSFKQRLRRCHQKAVNGVLKFKFSWGSVPQTPHALGVHRACSARLTWTTAHSGLNFKSPPLENPGSAPVHCCIKFAACVVSH